MKIFYKILCSLFIICWFQVNASEDFLEQKKTFYFVRHGITDWTIDTLFDGPQDLPLSSKGQEDIINMVASFKKFEGSSEEFPTSILHSHLKRCVETSQILQKSLVIQMLKQIDGLHEIYRGDWSKLDITQKEEAKSYLKLREYQKLYEIKVPDAEEWPAFLKRIEKVIPTCLQTDLKHPIIVTHGQVIKEFLKLKKCWTDELSSKWTGDKRPPLKVTYTGQAWAVTILE